MSDTNGSNLEKTIAALAEENRRAAEENRRAAEENRRLIEENRRTAEENRLTAEENRRTAEENRLAAEERRLAVEENRRTAEESANERRERQRELNKLSKMVGAIGNRFGTFTEGLFVPSMVKLLKNRFHAEVVVHRALVHRGGESREIDMLAYSNGRRNEAYVVEIKSHADEESLAQLRRTLEEFPRFFPDHKDKELYGILAAANMPENIAGQARKAGIYTARMSDEIATLSTPRGFTARSWRKK